MFHRVLTAALNHLLASEDWARARLKPFAGQRVRLEAAFQVLTLAVTDEGMFAAAPADAVAAVTVILPADLPLRVLGGRMGAASLMASAHVRGPADFADSLGFVLRHLRWDAAGDLAKLTGDIVAHRAIGAVERFVSWQRQSALNLAENVAEYLVEERPTVLGRHTAEHFSREIDDTTARLGPLERRVASLEAARRRVGKAGL